MAFAVMAGLGGLGLLHFFVFVFVFVLAAFCLVLDTGHKSSETE